MKENKVGDAAQWLKKPTSERGRRVTSLVVATGIGFAAGRATVPTRESTDPVAVGPKQELIVPVNPNALPTLDPRTLATAPGSLTEAEANRIGALRNETIKALAEVHNMKITKGITHKSGLSIRFISDGNILSDELNEQINKALTSEIASMKPAERPQTELDKAIDGYNNYLKLLPDSPMKQKLLDAIARAEAGRLSGYELHAVIPSSTTTYWQPPEMQKPANINPEYLRNVVQHAITPIPDSVSVDSHDLLRKQSGILFEEIGVSMVVINSASPNNTATRIFGGQVFTDLPLGEVLLTEWLHEYGHKLLVSAGIKRDLDTGAQEKLLEEADRKYLEARLSNPDNSPKIFNL
jgi:hypothetical protein